MNKGKSKAIAALLAFFLGIFGAHKFYLGRKNDAIKQFLCLIISLALSVLCDWIGWIFGFLGFIIRYAFLICIIWALVDFVYILMGKLLPVDGSYAISAKTRKKDKVYASYGANIKTLEELDQLAKLHEKGILNDAEFQEKKKQLLEKM